MKVAVTSKSFSKNLELKNHLLSLYPQSYFNEEGKTFDRPSLIEFLKDADACIVALEKVDNELLAALPNLQIYSKYGVGTDNIDFDALKKFQKKWAYTAGTNKRGVSELALQMMLVLIRKSYQSNLLLRNGQWQPIFGNNLTNKKIGILGLGNVGKDLVQLLRPFNCEISICEIAPDEQYITENKLKLVNIQTLFKENDVVTIHIPLSESNTKLINKNLIELMKPNAILINTARGKIVDEDALYEALVNKKIQSAGFDVFAEEPNIKSDLLQLENFYSTPHIGGSSVESILAMGLAAINGISRAKQL